MKRSTDTRRSPAEVKADLHRHYGGLADKKPDGHAVYGDVRYYLSDEYIILVADMDFCFRIQH